MNWSTAIFIIQTLLKKLEEIEAEIKQLKTDIESLKS